MIVEDETTETLLYYNHHNIYIIKKYVHHKSRWLRCNKVEDEQYSMAGGSPPLTYMSPCALEYR